MPEAVKEVVCEKVHAEEKITPKEVKPAEAESGTLPADDLPLKDVGEGAVAPDVAPDSKPEEGKDNVSESVEPAPKTAECKKEKSEDGLNSLSPAKAKSLGAPSEQVSDEVGDKPESNVPTSADSESKLSAVEEKQAEKEKDSSVKVDSDNGKVNDCNKESNQDEIKKSGDVKDSEGQKNETEPTSCEVNSEFKANEEAKNKGESMNSDADNSENKDHPDVKEKSKDSCSEEKKNDGACPAEKKDDGDQVKTTQDDVSTAENHSMEIAEPIKQKEPVKVLDDLVVKGVNVKDTELVKQEAPAKVDNVPAAKDGGEKTAEPVKEEPIDTKEVTHEETKKGTESAIEEMQVDELSEDSKPTNGSSAKESSDSGENDGKTEAGRSAEIDPLQVEEVQKLIREAKEQMTVAEFFSAADMLGKACEIAGKLYGDLASENAELYYLYGCSMLECAKNENAVLGEAVKENDAGDDDKEDCEESEEVDENGEKEDGEKNELNGDSEAKVNGDEAVNGDIDDEKMDVGENGDEANEEKDNSEAGTSDKEGGEGEETTAEEGKEDDEDSSLKTAWEMFELAKVIFTKTENNIRLSDTYVKLGEVGMESGHDDSIEDMKKALELRLKCASENDRLLAETHFHIGLALATFQKFDDAIESFQLSKSMIETKINKLKLCKQTNDAEAEIKELSELLPDLDEKIQDMRDSKEAKLKGEKEATNGENVGLGEGSSKPVSNITHLVKRKRKLEDVTSELLPSTKQKCIDDEAKSEESK